MTKGDALRNHAARLVYRMAEEHRILCEAADEIDDLDSNSEDSDAVADMNKELRRANEKLRTELASATELLAEAELLQEHVRRLQKACETAEIAFRGCGNDSLMRGDNVTADKQYQLAAEMFGAMFGLDEVAPSRELNCD